MIVYYITEAYKYLTRAKLSTLVAILSTSFALIFLSFSILIFFMSNSLETKIKQNIKVNILLNKDISQPKIDLLKKKISNNKWVSGVNFVSSQQAKKNFINETGEDFSKLLKNNPLPSSFVVKFHPAKINSNALKLFVNDYRYSDGVEDVIYDYNILVKLLKLSNPIKLSILIIAFLLNIFAVYFVYTINKHFILSRKNQFNTMKLVGAKVISIKIPLLMASLFIGIISSIFVIGLFDGSIILISKYYGKFIFTKMIYIFNLSVLIFGIMLSFISSYFAGKSISIKLN